jgi:hypothetical protein
MRSWLFRIGGNILNWTGHVLFTISVILVFPAMLFGVAGEACREWAWKLWKQQDFNGPCGDKHD